MQNWIEEGNLAVEIDEKILDYAYDKMGRMFPAYEQLVPPSVGLTSKNIISVRSEHGTWYATEFEDVNAAGRTVTYEVGVVVDWRSDAHPVVGCNPCFEAALYIGIPGDPEARWGFDTTNTVASVCAPTSNMETGAPIDDGTVCRTAYAKLIEVVEARV